ncbi:hypothetical protein BAUCODRAFT_127124 [Baudoinia panamericana UAMH 10762]|uniref:AB hydrolase-1 domain-containing protein n=1 Tax=Baudoinia panamericana (strain UAMH 10762) TaxID=717646 RepID=M2MY51_BAUPA|nr:uncharacterized protein BAUCODRAFT_127124 [Baudoinia panamericana UAMH 10762]EMC91210.1 hypothetical protein BAUCODRAFT_127124 [Baudoinia panamericana UAMH 10762]
MTSQQAKQQLPGLSRPDTPLDKPLQPSAFPSSVDHAPGTKPQCQVERLHIKVEDGPDGKVTGFLHSPSPYRPGQHSKTAAVLLSGAGGGVVGPSSMYLSMADKLASLPNQAVLALRLDYRYPARNKYCVPDVKAAVDFLQREKQIEKVVLVGWSFGSAPVFTFAAQDQRCSAAAVVAPQTAETEGMYKMPPRPVLLCHGTGDRTLSHSCSKRLQGMYRDADAAGKGVVKLMLFDGDDHALTKNAVEAERLITEFIMRRAGVELSEEAVKKAGEQLLPASKEEKVELMKKGGDLKGPESVD